MRAFSMGLPSSSPCLLAPVYPQLGCRAWHETTGTGGQVLLLQPVTKVLRHSVPSQPVKKCWLLATFGSQGSKSLLAPSLLAVW